MSNVQNLMDFIDRCPTAFHVVANAEKMLLDAGFTKLSEDERFHIEKGGKYFVTRNSSAIISFRVPENPKAFAIVSAHSDSPCFKLKEHPEVTGLYTTLNVEKYGGMIMSPWFDRPLSVAGRVFVKEDGKIVEKLFNVDRDLLSLVNLCVHFNRDINDGHKYDAQKEIQPILCTGSKPGVINELIAKKLNVDIDSIIDSDLFLYNRDKGRIWGLNREFFSSPKIDDLGCAYSSLDAITKCDNRNSIAVSAIFDNEEVGSGTKQGALSDFLVTVLTRISNSLGWDQEDLYIAQSRSMMLSADNGHAVHPNYAEKSDITNRPVVNGGVLIKYSANQKYTTDGKSAAYLKDILKTAQIPYQEFHNNSNVLGGSTLGNLSAQKFSISTVDIGCAQLAMHSPYETAGVYDIDCLMDAMRTFYNVY